MESVQDSSQAFVGLRVQLNNAELQHKSLLSQLEVFHYRRLLLCVQMTHMHEEDPSPAPFTGEAAVKFSRLEDKDSDLMDEADEFCKQLDDFYDKYGRTFAEIAKFLTSAGALPDLSAEVSVPELEIYRASIRQAVKDLGKYTMPIHRIWELIEKHEGKHRKFEAQDSFFQRYYNLRHEFDKRLNQGVFQNDEFVSTPSKEFISWALNP